MCSTSCTGWVCALYKRTPAHPLHMCGEWILKSCPIRNCRDRRDEPTVIGDGMVICTRHDARLRSSLVELPSYYVKLALSMVPGSTQAVDVERVDVSKTAPLALNVDARACQEDICRVAWSAERAYRAQQRWSAMTHRGRESFALARSVRFVSRHLDGVMASSWAEAWAVELLGVVGVARLLLGLDKLIHRLPAPCPSCDCMTLERESGASKVRCRYCGRSFDEAEYNRLVLILASEQSA